MPRLMSVALTKHAVRSRQKTVTRRLGWLFLRPGDRLTLCEKVRGRRKGEPLVRLCTVEVVSVSRERLDAITPAELVREGFPDWTPAEFVAMFTRSMRCQPDTTVTRVEWRYPCAPAITLPPDCGWTPCEDCYLPCFRPLGHLVPHRVLATGVDRNEDDVPVDVVDQVRHRCAGPAPGGGIRPATLGWPDA